MPRSPGALQCWLADLCRSTTSAAKNAIALGALAGFALSPGSAGADYVSIGADQAATVVRSENRAQILEAASSGESAFDARRVRNYPLFKLFWESDIEGTSRRGVWSLSRRGVTALLRHAQTQTLDGHPLPQARQPTSDVPPPVTEGNRRLVEFLLNDEYYSAFISQESIPLLRLAFDLPEVVVRPRAEAAPVDAGDGASCPQNDRGERAGIATRRIKDLPRALRSEYELGAPTGRYERTTSTNEERASELACMLQQFSNALNRLDDLALPRGDQVRHNIQEELLDQFFALPIFNERTHGETARWLKRYFATDFNGSVLPLMPGHGFVIASHRDHSRGGAGVVTIVGRRSG